MINTFIVPKGASDFSLGKKYDKMSWQQSSTHECIFENRRIPKSDLLGRE